MTDDRKPRQYFIVDSSQLNGQPTRVYNTEPKWLVGAVEWKSVIELEPTLQLMKEMCEIIDSECCIDEKDFILKKYRKFLEGVEK